MDSGDRWDFRNSLWVSDHELIVTFSRPQTNGRTRFLIGRTMLLDMKTRKARELFKRQRNLGCANQDAILGRDYDQPGGFYILGAKGSNPKIRGVFAVRGTPQRLPSRPVQSPQKDIVDWGDQPRAASASAWTTAISGVVVQVLQDAEGIGDDVTVRRIEKPVYWRSTKNTNRYYDFDAAAVNASGR